MTDPFTRLVCREAGGDGGRGKRTRGPRRRPPYIAHPATWWSDDVTADHLAGCRTGRGSDGEWRPWDELDQNERWCQFWEMSVKADGTCIGGETRPVEVP
jgi:hypothetical protein